MGDVLGVQAVAAEVPPPDEVECGRLRSLRLQQVLAGRHHPPGLLWLLRGGWEQRHQLWLRTAAAAGSPILPAAPAGPHGGGYTSVPPNVLKWCLTP